MFLCKEFEAKLKSHETEIKWSISFVEPAEDFELGYVGNQKRHLGEMGEGQDCAFGNTAMQKCV